MGCQWPIGRGVPQIGAPPWDGEDIWSGYGPAHLVGKPRRALHGTRKQGQGSLVQGLDWDWPRGQKPLRAEGRIGEDARYSRVLVGSVSRSR